MMSVLEYAEDVGKSVEEILELCKNLNISKSNENSTDISLPPFVLDFLE